MFVFTQGLHALLIRQTPAKRGSFSMRIVNRQHHVFKQLWINFKNRNICLRYLKMLVLPVWIYILVSVKYGVHMKFLSWIKNSFKTRKIAVNLTELSSTRTGIKFKYFN